MNITKSPPQHFYALDAIRGIAAVIVVLYHWQFYYYANDTWVKESIDKAALPFYPYLSAIYNEGAVAVDLFFLLSGFIFFWLYAERIANEKMDFRKFMVFRLSRLYPIHLVTLISVAILQWLMLRNAGHYFIVQYNDTYHFILNLFFIQNWGFEKGLSLNSPSWSGSVEVFLYLVFFVICFLKLQNKKWLLFLFIPIGVFIQYYFSLIGKGMYSFFLGALVYYLYVWMLKEDRAKKYLSALVILTVFIWILLFAEYYFSYLRDIFMKHYLDLFPNKTSESAQSAFALGKNFAFRTFVSPCTVLAITLWETCRGTLSKKWAVIGDCSYAMYLIHFSLNITFALLADAFHIDRIVLHSPITLFIFFLILLPLSFFIHKYLEVPAQQKLRNSFYKSKSRDVGLAEMKVKAEQIP